MNRSLQVSSRLRVGCVAVAMCFAISFAFFILRLCDSPSQSLHTSFPISLLLCSRLLLFSLFEEAVKSAPRSFHEAPRYQTR